MLQTAESREIDAAKILLLIFDVGVYFGRAEIARVEESQHNHDDAGVTDSPREHSQIILGVAEDIAPDDLASELAAEERKYQNHEEHDCSIRREVRGQVAEHGALAKKGPERLVSQ